MAQAIIAHARGGTSALVSGNRADKGKDEGLEMDAPETTVYSRQDPQLSAGPRSRIRRPPPEPPPREHHRTTRYLPRPGDDGAGFNWGQIAL